MVDVLAAATAAQDADTDHGTDDTDRDGDAVRAWPAVLVEEPSLDRADSTVCQCRRRRLCLELRQSGDELLSSLIDVGLDVLRCALSWLVAGNGVTHGASVVGTESPVTRPGAPTATIASLLQEQVVSTRLGTCLRPAVPYGALPSLQSPRSGLRHSLHAQEGALGPRRLREHRVVS